MSVDEPRLLSGDIVVDDRGSVSFVNGFDLSSAKRFYLVENHQAGFVRAWHGHRREGKHVLVVAGAAIVAVVKIADWEGPGAAGPVKRFVLSAAKPATLYVPPGYANGFKSLTPHTKIMFFSTCTVEESRNADVRWGPHQFGDVWTVEQR